MHHKEPDFNSSLSLRYAKISDEKLIKELIMGLDLAEKERVILIKKYITDELKRKDSYKQTLQQKIKDYKRECNGESLNLIITHKLLTEPEIKASLQEYHYIDKKSEEPATKIEEYYKTGFWIRNIDHDKEIDYLCHSINKFFPEEKSATFIRQGIPVNLFSGLTSKVSLMIKLKSRTTISAWNSRFIDGERLRSEVEEIAHNIEKNELSEKEEGVYLCRDSEQIGNLLHLYYEQMLDERYHAQKDRYGIINREDIRKEQSYMGLGWNEGFIEYTKENIIALRIEKDNPDSIIHGLYFMQQLSISVPMYYYDAQLGAIKIASDVNFNTQLKAMLGDDGLEQKYQDIVAKKNKSLPAIAG